MTNHNTEAENWGNVRATGWTKKLITALIKKHSKAVQTVGRHSFSWRRAHTAAAAGATALVSDRSSHLDGVRRSPRAVTRRNPCMLMYALTHVCTYGSNRGTVRPTAPRVLTGDQSVWLSTWFKNITLYLSAVVCSRKSDHVEMGHYDVWKCVTKKIKKIQD